MVRAALAFGAVRFAASPSWLLLLVLRRRRLRRRRQATAAAHAEQRRAGARREGRRAQARRRSGARLPVFATKNTTRVGGADPVANAAGVAQAVYPARTRRDAARRRSCSSTRATGASAISAAQLMAPPAARAGAVLRRRRAAGGDRRGAEELAPAGRAGGRRRAGDPDRRRRREARRRAARRRTVAGADSAALAQAIDKLQAKARRRARRRPCVVASADDPEFAMPAAGWAAKSGDPVLWTRKDSLPAATRAAIQAHTRAADLRARPARGGLRRRACAQLAQARHGEADRRRRPGGERDRLRALHRRARSAGASSTRATGSCSRTSPRPLDAAAGVAAVRLRDLRAAAAAHRGPGRCPRRCRTTCSTSSPATTRTRCAAFTITAG